MTSYPFLCCVFFFKATIINFPTFPAKSLSGDFCLKILDVQIRTAYASSHLQPTMAPRGFGMRLGGLRIGRCGDEMRVEEPPKPWVNVFLFSDLILVFSDFVTGSRRNQFNALSLSFSQFLF